jgi:adenosylcobyric acid synthase
MIQGTASDVGKSVICTALCRILARKGIRVTPFKSQNMSNNSYVTVNNEEIGRAQGIQAEAAKVEATVFMNPILLKPTNDRQAEVVHLGKRLQTLSGRGYRDTFYETGIKTIHFSLQKLEKEYEFIVIEGAGSPVEMNLNDRELVNMKVAEMAEVPVILVADIDRGGVFASLVGTMQLLEPQDRSRVIGVVINKFRGDPSLFEQGLKWIEEHLNVPVLAVLPYMNDIRIEAEDSLALAHYKNKEKNGQSYLDIVVIDLPYVSNHTDLEPFLVEEDVSLRFVSRGEKFGNPDAVILPGTKSTIEALTWMNDTKLTYEVQRYIEDGGTIVGICGGYQLLGETIIDEAGSDTGVKGKKIKGLGLLALETKFKDLKTTVRSIGNLLHPSNLRNSEINGYEIHLGQTRLLDTKIASFMKLNGRDEGVYAQEGRVIGTYLHHLFFHDEWRNRWLNRLRVKRGLASKPTLSYMSMQEHAYDELADAVLKEWDCDHLLALIENWESHNVDRV